MGYVVRSQYWPLPCVIKDITRETQSCKIPTAIAISRDGQKTARRHSVLTTPVVGMTMAPDVQDSKEPNEYNRNTRFGVRKVIHMPYWMHNGQVAFDGSRSPLLYDDDTISPHGRNCVPHRRQKNSACKCYILTVRSIPKICVKINKADVRRSTKLRLIM